MKKKGIGLKLLSYVQCMSQQNMIRKEERMELSSLIATAMRDGNYSDVEEFLRRLQKKKPNDYLEYALQDLKQNVCMYK